MTFYVDESKYLNSFLKAIGESYIQIELAIKSFNNS